MNKTPLIAIMAATLLLCLSCLTLVVACTEEDVAETNTLPLVSVQGTKLVTSTGEELALRGVNAGGLFVMESWMCPTNAPDQRTAREVLTQRFGEDKCEELLKAYMASWWKEEDFEYIAALGLDHIRLPISYLEMMDSEYNIRDDAFTLLDWFIATAEKYGLYVLLDLHSAPGSQNGKDHSGDISAADDGGLLFTTAEYMDATAYLWQEIATRYKDNNAVLGYDLLNEPSGTVSIVKGNSVALTDETEWAFFDRLYDVIRAIDDRHIIFFEAVWDPKDMCHPSVYGWTNVVYQYHFYNWSTGENLALHRFYLTDKKQQLEKANHGVPVYVGEFSVFCMPEGLSTTLSFFNTQQYGWALWTYKVAFDNSDGCWSLKWATLDEADIYNDSYEAILQKWQATDSVNFTENTGVVEQVKLYVARK